MQNITESGRALLMVMFINAHLSLQRQHHHTSSRAPAALGWLVESAAAADTLAATPKLAWPAKPGIRVKKEHMRQMADLPRHASVMPALAFRAMLAFFLVIWPNCSKPVMRCMPKMPPAHHVHSALGKRLLPSNQYGAHKVGQYGCRTTSLQCLMTIKWQPH